jgi:uncharacterized membrane protein YgcG
MYQYIYRRVGDVETARDLTADLFGALLKAAQNGRGPDQHIRAWLYRAAHNIVIDHYRSRQHRQHLPLSEELVSAHDDPASLSESRLSAEVVRTALMNQPESADRDQTRNRIEDCDSTECNGAPDQDRLRDGQDDADQIETPDQDQTQDRTGDCDSDCDGTPDQIQDRDQDQDGSGDGVQDENREQTGQNDEVDQGQPSDTPSDLAPVDNGNDSSGNGSSDSSSGSNSDGSSDSGGGGSGKDGK